MSALEFILEFGLWGGHYKRLPGASWHATIIDAPTGQRYAGSDDDPWMAIAWALDERELRRSGGLAMARNPGDRPGALR